MNIFFLNTCPSLAAQDHCDQHVVKMILETAQLLSTAHQLDPHLVIDKSKLYKATHINHPIALWVRRSKENYLWAYYLFVALRATYTDRYKKDHACDKLGSTLSFVPSYLKNRQPTELTIPPLCMPEQYMAKPCVSWSDVIDSYKRYYRGEKKKFARYYYSPIPEYMK